MFDVLMSAPYMLPFVNRFTPVFKHYGIKVILPEVKERLEEDVLLGICRKVRWRHLRR